MPTSTEVFFPFTEVTFNQLQDTAVNSVSFVNLALSLFAVPRLCWVRLLVQTGTNDSYYLSSALALLWATVQINLA